MDYFNKNQIKESRSVKEAGLNQYMYIIIISGFAFAIFLLTVGFLINIAGGGNLADYKDFEQNTLGPEKLAVIFNNGGASMLNLFEYAGIFCLILVPVSGIICAVIFFARSKKYKLAIIAIGVLVILVLSAVIGFMK